VRNFIAIEKLKIKKNSKTKLVKNVAQFNNKRFIILNLNDINDNNKVDTNETLAIDTKGEVSNVFKGMDFKDYSKSINYQDSSDRFDFEDSLKNSDFENSTKDSDSQDFTKYFNLEE